MSPSPSIATPLLGALLALVLGTSVIGTSRAAGCPTRQARLSHETGYSRFHPDAEGIPAISRMVEGA